MSGSAFQFAQLLKRFQIDVAQPSQLPPQLRDLLIDDQRIEVSGEWWLVSVAVIGTIDRSFEDCFTSHWPLATSHSLLIQLRQLDLIILTQPVGKRIAIVFHIVDDQLAGVGLFLLGLPLGAGGLRSLRELMPF